MLSNNPENLIGSRLCYERVKMIEQTKHYQRLLEVKPTLEFFSKRPQKTKMSSIHKDL